MDKWTVTEWIYKANKREKCLLISEVRKKESRSRYIDYLYFELAEIRHFLRDKGTKALPLQNKLVFCPTLTRWWNSPYLWRVTQGSHKGMDSSNYVMCPRSLEWMLDLFYPRLTTPRSVTRGTPHLSHRINHASLGQGNRTIVTSSFEREQRICFFLYSGHKNPSLVPSHFPFCPSQRCFTRWPTRTRTESKAFYLTLPFLQGSIAIGLFFSEKEREDTC